jgi:thiamine-monophosphate kinase
MTGGPWYMDLSHIGERELISSIVSTIQEIQAGLPGDVLGLEDDCAALETGDGYLLVTTDSVNSRTHFPTGSPMELVGWYSVAVNLSDLAAMGAEPLGLLLSFGFPIDMRGDDTSELVEGAVRCATQFGVPVIGGDTKRHDVVTVTGVALGRAPAGEIMPRRSRTLPEEGDAVVVTGTLGGAAAGCLIARRTLDAGDVLRERERYTGALQHVLNVRPRLKEGRALAGTGRIRMAMDLSDGLARSLHTLGGLNSCGFRLSMGKVPVDEYALENAVREGTPLEELCLYYGGDFELVAIVGGGAQGLEEARTAVEGAGGSLTQVGVVAPGDTSVLEADGEERPLEDRGWEHFFSNLRF